MELTVFNTYYQVNIQLKYLPRVNWPHRPLYQSCRYLLKLVIKTIAYTKIRRR